MMKKTYIAPTAKSYMVNTMGILAASQFKVLSAGDGSDALSKQNNDDWE